MRLLICPLQGKYDARWRARWLPPGERQRRLPDGCQCSFLDYYGVKGAVQGYVPFIVDSLKSGRFVRADTAFSFPYGFKHGTVLPIAKEEYEHVKNHLF